MNLMNSRLHIYAIHRKPQKLLKMQLGYITFLTVFYMLGIFVSARVGLWWLVDFSVLYILVDLIQGDHLSGKPGKPGNVRDFDSCQWNVGDFTKCRGSVREKILSGKSGQKLFIVSCIFASILDLAKLVHFILVLDHALLYSYPHHWQWH